MRIGVSRITLLSLIVLYLCGVIMGCATSSMIQLTDDIKGVCSEEHNWYEEAGYISGNYPKMTPNEKAAMLYERMKEHGAKKVELVKHKYKVERYAVVQDGYQLYPQKKNKWDRDAIKDWLLSRRY